MEPFDIDYFGVQLTVLPQTDGSFTIFCNTELIGTVVPTIEDEPLTVWISNDLLEGYEAHTIGTLIEEYHMGY